MSIVNRLHTQKALRRDVNGTTEQKTKEVSGTAIGGDRLHPYPVFCRQIGRFRKDSQRGCESPPEQPEEICGRNPGEDGKRHLSF